MIGPFLSPRIVLTMRKILHKNVRPGWHNFFGLYSVNKPERINWGPRFYGACFVWGRNTGPGFLGSDCKTYIMIRKLKSGQYRIYSRKKDEKTGKRRNLGTFDSMEAAKKHERAIQYFKHG